MTTAKQAIDRYKAQTREECYLHHLPGIKHATHCGKDEDKAQTVALAAWEWFLENWERSKLITGNQMLEIEARCVKLVRSKRKDVFGVCNRVDARLETIEQPEQPQEVCYWSIEMLPLRLATFARALLSANGNHKCAATILGCHENTVTNRLAQCERWLRDHNQVI